MWASPAVTFGIIAVGVVATAIAAVSSMFGVFYEL